MYFRMLVLFNKSIADSPSGAISYVINQMRQPNDDENIGFGRYDSFSIGGSWTSTLTTSILDQEKLLCFVEEVKRRFGFEIERSTFISNKALFEKKKEQASIVFYKYFPNFKGELPFFRSDDYRMISYEDDAQIVEDERKFYKWLGMYEGYSRFGSLHDGIQCIDLNGTIISPENTIGKKWVVVVSCHM